MADGWPEAVEEAWRHFLFDRLKPYLEAGGVGAEGRRMRPMCVARV